ASLSDAQCGQLRSFVARGGSLIATSETSLEDEWGVRRPEFGLADLFGASWKGRFEGPMKNSYVRLEHERFPKHALLRGLEDAPRIINGVWRVDVAQNSFPADSPLTLIPSYPDLPMEKVYPRRARTDTPEVFLRDGPGSGRVVYFPWDIDRTYWEVLSVDHGKLMQNAVAWATNEEPPVWVKGQGVVDVTFWRQKASLTVHLVNLTNPMMMKGPIRELMAVGEQNVRVRVPDGLEVRGVHLLVAGGTPEYSKAGEWLKVRVPSILAHEVIGIDT
ncbi:MAG TPA: hypothetical protein VII09_05920, partial [Opitutaceae bacterium]